MTWPQTGPFGNHAHSSPNPSTDTWSSKVRSKIFLPFHRTAPSPLRIPVTDPPAGGRRRVRPQLDLIRNSQYLCAYSTTTLQALGRLAEPAMEVPPHVVSEVGRRRAPGTASGGSPSSQRDRIRSPPEDIPHSGVSRAAIGASPRPDRAGGIRPPSCVGASRAALGFRRSSGFRLSLSGRARQSRRVRGPGRAA